MQKLAIFLVSMALAFIPVSGAFAQGSKIGVIDIREIVQQSKQVKQLEEQLQKKFQVRKDEIVALHKELNEQNAKLNRDSSVMTEAKRQELQDKILEKKRDLLHKEQNFQQDATLAQNQAMDGFFKQVEKIVSGIAEKEKYDVILQKNVTPYASKQIDITSSVISQLN